MSPPPQITGFKYEVEACKKAIENGQVSCPDAPLEHRIKILHLMDSLRNQWGVHFPFE